MKIFLDTADIVEIRRWHDMGVIDGVTTNPTIMLKDRIIDIEAGTKEITALLAPMPMSVEVTTNDRNEMLAQARIFASWAPNIVVKIPQITADGAPCYGVIKALEGENIRVNATAAMSLGQVILAAKAGATYISIFYGRIADEGGDPATVIRDSVSWLERWGFKSEIIVGSIRSVGDILGAAKAGSHVLTIPPSFMGKLADHKYTRETVRQFVADAEDSLQMIENLRSEARSQ